MEKMLLYVKDNRSFFSRSICGIVSKVFADGWGIDVAKSPSVALPLLEKKSYLVVISDLGFGKREINGVDFLLQVKENCRDIRTILVVGEFHRQNPTLKIEELKLLLSVDFLWKKIGTNQKVKKRGEKILAKLFQRKSLLGGSGSFFLPENPKVGECNPWCPCCQRRDGHA